MYRIGIDTGGTFTDFVAFGDGGIATHKVASTPDDPARAIVEGLKCFPAASPGLEIIHGTTVGTNAFLQRKGARTLLVTTHGFEDVLLIGRQNRQRIYDLAIERPAPVIPREWIAGIRERMLHDGRVLTAPGPGSGRRLRRLCRDLDIESVAVCLLHSYANPAHEQFVGEQLKALGLPITLSAELLPEFREYERLTTTLINAYLAPVVASYIERLMGSLPGTMLSIQQSNGTILPAEGIGRRAVHTVLSGPAGGVQGAWELGQQTGITRLITFDMGGTSTDVSLCDGTPTLTRDYQLDTFPIRNQVMDIHTVGAGGGSVAWIDRGGLLKVGPLSAGAVPGPACYGRGEEITVTDANLHLGRIPPALLGGGMKLDRRRTDRLLAGLGEKLGLTATEVALGIVRIVNAGMTGAIRAVSLERGHTPADFALFSFGGASGLHCCELALDLGIERIVVPARAGVLSAQGMCLAVPAMDFSRSFFHRGRRLATACLPPLDELAGHGRQQLLRLVPAGTVAVDRYLDLRYHGQAHELTIPWSAAVEEEFHREHEHLFGYRQNGAELEVVSLRIRARLVREPIALPRNNTPATRPPRPASRRPVAFADGSRREIPVFRRSELRFGHQLTGPALIDDDYTTVLVGREFSLRIDGLENMVLERKG
ncbi:MAG: hydantoinase/oxoprolinase family protein [Thermodesulfobacteriota bacterium]